MPRRFTPHTARATAIVLALVSALTIISPADARSSSAVVSSVGNSAPTCNINVTGENGTDERIDILSIRSTNRAGVSQQFTYGNTSPRSLLALSITSNNRVSFPAVASGVCLGEVQYTVNMRKGRVTKDVVFPSPAAFTTNKSFAMGDASKYF